MFSDRYCYKIPDGYPLALAAPLLCAGITVYTPMMKHAMNQPGKCLGVVGLGGLGHMAVKFGKTFGLNVTVLSTSESKRKEAIEELGADRFIIFSDKKEMEVTFSLLFFTSMISLICNNFKMSSTFLFQEKIESENSKIFYSCFQGMNKSLDFIIDTASGDHPFDPYMALLKTNGVLALVGFPGEIKLSPASLNLGTYQCAYLDKICSIGLKARWNLNTVNHCRYEIYLGKCYRRH